MLDCREIDGDVTIKVKVQPRASKNTITGLVGDSLKVALTSPPVEGEANEACIKFFANLCGVPKNHVIIISGLKNREKVIKITGFDKTTLIAIINAKYKFD